MKFGFGGKIDSMKATEKKKNKYPVNVRPGFATRRLDLANGKKRVKINSSRWFKVPFSSRVGGNLTIWKGHLTITKRSLWITRFSQYARWWNIQWPNFYFIPFFREGGHGISFSTIYIKGSTGISPGPKEGHGNSRRIARQMGGDFHPDPNPQVPFPSPSGRISASSPPVGTLGRDPSQSPFK